MRGLGLGSEGSKSLQGLRVFVGHGGSMQDMGLELIGACVQTSSQVQSTGRWLHTWLCVSVPLGFWLAHAHLGTPLSWGHPVMQDCVILCSLQCEDTECWVLGRGTLSSVVSVWSEGAG